MITQDKNKRYQREKRGTQKNTQRSDNTENYWEIMAIQTPRFRYLMNGVDFYFDRIKPPLIQARHVEWIAVSF